MHRPHVGAQHTWLRVARCEWHIYLKSVTILACDVAVATAVPVADMADVVLGTSDVLSERARP